MNRTTVSKTICIVVIPLALWGVYINIQNWSAEDAAYNLIMSLVVLFIAIGGLLPDSVFASEENPETEEAIIEDEEDETSRLENEKRAEASRLDQKTTIMVTRNYKDDGIDRLEKLLKDDKRITSMRQEQGRHYSVPDGDDLPEWFSLYIGCRNRHCEELIEHINTLINTDDGFDEEDSSALQVRDIY